MIVVLLILVDVLLELGEFEDGGGLGGPEGRMGECEVGGLERVVTGGCKVGVPVLEGDGGEPFEELVSFFSELLILHLNDYRPMMA